MARADLALVGAFLILWAKQYGTTELGLSETEALAKGAALVGIANGVALIGAPVIGIISDKLSRVDAVLIALGTAGVGYTATVFVEDPFSPIGYTVAAIIGLGQVSAVIASQVLVAEQSPARIRGSVIGVFALFGGIGIMIALGAGGWLFDVWRPAGPVRALRGLRAAGVRVRTRGALEDPAQPARRVQPPRRRQRHPRRLRPGPVGAPARSRLTAVRGQRPQSAPGPVWSRPPSQSSVAPVT